MRKRATHEERRMEVVAGLAGLAMGDYQKMEDVGDCESCGWELCGCKGLLSAKRGSGGSLARAYRSAQKGRPNKRNLRPPHQISLSL